MTNKRQSRDEYILEEYKKARKENSINNTEDIIQDLVERVTLLEKKLKESEDWNAYIRHEEFDNRCG
mgnify:CR=1 FL=1